MYHNVMRLKVQVVSDAKCSDVSDPANSSSKFAPRVKLPDTARMIMSNSILTVLQIHGLGHDKFAC